MVNCYNMTSTSQPIRPTSSAELQKQIRENYVGSRRPIHIRGGGTGASAGYLQDDPSAIVLTTTGLSRVIDYPKDDMTITIEAGLTIAELTGTLVRHRQQLPIDVPVPEQATIGGVVAANISGSRRFGYGTMRDYLIGIIAVDVQGQQFSAGGRVVKNVAGYDLCKLMIGSLGTLAVISQVTLKLKPVSESTGILWATFETLDDIDVVLETLLLSSARPVALDVLNARAAQTIVTGAELKQLPTEQPVLAITVDGLSAEVDWQLESLRKELAVFMPTVCLPIVNDDQRQKLQSAITQFSQQQSAVLALKANLPPSATLDWMAYADEEGLALLSHAGNGIVKGRFPVEPTEYSRAIEILGRLRAKARQYRGNVVVDTCPHTWRQKLPMFGDPEPSWSLMRKIKQQLDPDDLLNRGMFNEFRLPALRNSDGVTS